MLPVEVEFDLSERNTCFSGSGIVDLFGGSGNTKFYQARVFVNDPGGVIFGAFEKAIEHAAISNSQFLHLTLRRDRKPEEKANFDGIVEYKPVLMKLIVFER